MTETEVVHIETPEAPADSAEEIAEAIVEAQEEVREELEQEAAVETAVEASETALEAVALHGHPEYAEQGHMHPESDYSERMSSLESRLDVIEAGLAEEPEETVEEIEPTPTPPAEPEHRRTGLRRGRS